MYLFHRTMGLIHFYRKKKDKKRKVRKKLKADYLISIRANLPLGANLFFVASLAYYAQKKCRRSICYGTLFGLRNIYSFEDLTGGTVGFPSPLLRRLTHKHIPPFCNIYGGRAVSKEKGAKRPVVSYI